MIVVQAVALDDARARTWWDEQQAELRTRYGGEEDAEADFASTMDPRDVIVSLLASDNAGEPVGTGMIRWAPEAYGVGAGAAEVKRLYVRPEHRGEGYSRVIMGALERAAFRAGATRIVLETGTEQPEALGLYHAIGYDRRPNFGPYAHDPRSVCLVKDLPTRVLVLNGTMGAGKTEIASAVFDVLAGAGARVAAIDVDWLCAASPAPATDRFNEGLAFANLAAVAPVYRARGIGLVVVARPIEDPAGRDRFAAAFAHPDAGPAQVAVVRLEASEAVRQERLRARESAEFYETFARARTGELAASIVQADVDDAVVANDGRDRMDVALEVLEAFDWWPLPSLDSQGWM